MARTIREFRQAGTARLLRAQQTAQATIDSFPDPVVVVDPTGVGRAGQPGGPAGPGRGRRRDGPIPWTPAAAAPRARWPRSSAAGVDRRPTGLEHALAYRDDGQERFFLPHVLAIRDEAQGLLGAAVVLTDVTRFRLLDQLKSDMVSTVSHELKTPLTGVQMAVHLLLEEVVGPLNPKQIELLLAARQDSDRLLAMINDLLDLTRIEQGRVRLDRQPVGPGRPGRRGGRAVRVAGQGRRGRARTGAVGFGLPPVSVDRERVGARLRQPDRQRPGAHAPGRLGPALGRAEAGRGGRASRSRTPARGSPRSTWPGSSRSSTGSPARSPPAGPGSAWPSPARSSRPTAARSRPRASPGGGPPSPSPCRPPPPTGRARPEPGGGPS